MRGGRDRRQRIRVAAVIDALRIRAEPAAGRKHGNAGHQAIVDRQRRDRSAAVVVKLAKVVLFQGKTPGVDLAQREPLVAVKLGRLADWTVFEWPCRR